MRGDAGRFVWDWWHIPGEYTYLRTPAWLYFPRTAYDAFHQRLVWWGRRVLGCHDVSPPWLSAYVEGCRQQPHVDAPHGPWAFVFSLTPWERRVFSGGETLLFGRGQRVERSVEPRFNRLTVFDPNLRHGVRQVRGTHDPRHGRLVVHGWFVQPRPFIEGPLPTAALARHIDDVTESLQPLLRLGLEVTGALSLSFTVVPSGAVKGLKTLTDTTRAPRRDARGHEELLEVLRKSVRAMAFGRQRKTSRVTLPFVFAAR